MKQPKRPKPGKPRLSDVEQTVLVSVRMTPTQRQKFKALGGSEWVRAQIDAAEANGVERRWQEQGK